MFIYSLPLLFNEMGVFRPWEFVVIVLMFAGLCWLTAPVPWNVKETDEYQAAERNYLKLAWLGRLPLWQVFWPFFALLNIALYGVDNLAKMGEFTVSSWDDVHFILFTPILFWSLCVWRNSANCGDKLWAALARLSVLLVYFEYALKLIIRLDYPRIFFNCNELLLDYSACF